ncbi:hypothetical protein B4U80_01953 [Leptotrombidium deliense]|nr:hypothetical protein B4U80_01953 [Leptotrombidium deliense]
MFLFPFQ